VSPSAAIVCTVSGFRNQVCLRGQSGLSAKWYRNYNGLPLMSTTPSLQNAVPNLNFPLSTNDACSIMTLTSALNAYSGCMSNDFAAKFEGCGFSHIYLCLCVYNYILVCICICSYDVLTYVCFAAFHHCVVLPKF
jgi:hypothetical protein